MQKYIRNCVWLHAYIHAAYCSHLSCVWSTDYDPTDHQTQREAEGASEHPRAWNKTNIRLGVRAREAMMMGKKSWEAADSVRDRGDETEEEWMERKKRDLNFFPLKLQAPLPYPPLLFTVINSSLDVKIWITSAEPLWFSHSFSQHVPVCLSVAAAHSHNQEMLYPECITLILS